MHDDAADGTLKRTQVPPVWSDEDLAEGRRLAEDLTRTQFALGDLALRVAGPAPARGARDGSYRLLTQFAEEIGISGDSMRQYRFVAGAWPVEERIEGASWSLHRALANHEDRHEILADFMAAARRGDFKPTRTKLMSWVREHQTDLGSSDDPFGIRESIRGWAKESSGFIRLGTREPIPWDLQRRREWGIILMVDASMLPPPENTDEATLLRVAQVLTVDEQMMSDILTEADVLPRMRLAFGTWVARMYGGDLADDVIDPGRLPDVEALSILWEALLNWSQTPDGQRGWQHVVGVLSNTMSRRLKELRKALKSPGSNAMALRRGFTSAMQFGHACALSGREDIKEAATSIMKAISETAEKLTEAAGAETENA